jgi:hypothetical protein
VNGHIRDWIWFSVVVIVLFGIVGLKVITRWKNNGSSDEDYSKYDGSGIVG